METIESPMRIESYTTYCQEIEMDEPMQLSFINVRSRPSGVVRIQTNSRNHSIVGLGEGVTLPFPLFTDDFGGNITNNTQLLCENLLNKSEPCISLIEMNQEFQFNDKGHYPTARLAVEMALLDTYAKAEGVNIAKILGTNDIRSVPFGKSIGALSHNDMIAQARSSITKGAKKIKFKVSPTNYPEVLIASDILRSDLPDLELMIDANGGFDPNKKEDLLSLQKLDDFGFLMIEEPVSRVGATQGLSAFQLLRLQLPEFVTPLCLDDCLTDYNSCKTAMDEDVADIINIKPGRIGSFMRSINLIDYAATIGKQVMVGGMFEATPGRCMTLQLGAYCLKKGFTIPGDLSLAQERLAGDLVPEQRQLRLALNGEILMPTSVGWGF